MLLNFKVTCVKKFMTSNRTHESVNKQQQYIDNLLEIVTNSYSENIGDAVTKSMNITELISHYGWPHRPYISIKPQNGRILPIEAERIVNLTRIKSRSVKGHVLTALSMSYLALAPMFIAHDISSYWIYTRTTFQASVAAPPSLASNADVQGITLIVGEFAGFVRI